MSSLPDRSTEDAATGFVCGVAAYGMWGFIPLYFRLLTGTRPLDILAHRTWWSFVVLAAIMIVWRHGPDIRTRANRAADDAHFCRQAPC